MAISVHAEDRVSEDLGDEEVYLPGEFRNSDLEGPYEFTYPRLGRLIRMQRRLRGLNMAEAAAEEVDGMMQWLAAGFGVEAWQHIEARLESDTDVLDEEHLVRLFQLLNESKGAGTGRPTTSSSGASRQPWKKDPTAAPSQLESVSAT